MQTLNKMSANGAWQQEEQHHEQVGPRECRAVSSWEP